MFNFINRDHFYGLLVATAFFGAAVLFTGCTADKDDDTADTADECTVEETTTPTPTTTPTTTTPTTTTTTGTDTGAGSDTGVTTS